MTDERIDALIRRLDVPSDPSQDFVRSTYASLRPRARAARVSEASRIGRLRRDLRLMLAGSRSPAPARSARMLGLVILLALATLLALAIVGAMNRTIQNGPLIVSMGGELQAIDVVDGSIRSILPPGDRAEGVSRSPDGRLVAFWTVDGGHSHLWVIGIDGRDRRELGSDLASDLGLGWANAIDVWSSDSRFLATEVRPVGEEARIIVADVVTGSARVVTPPGLVAHNPLWSPDDRWIAFAEETTGTRSLAVIRTDGSGKRTISGDIVGVAGPDTWSPDGSWIYFDANPTLGNRRDNGVYRANVAGGFSQLLIGNGLGLDAAFAPASSPDGTLIVFIVPRSDGQATDLYIANSDGSGSHRLLERATHDGWSADGRYILAEWTPADQPGGLAVIAPDGSDFRVLLPFDGCVRNGSGCTDGVGWGQPRP
jgi:dipeptidyl aminopeptidase/acylaminoacyl peptidase